MIQGFFANLNQSWRLDGVTILHAIVIIPAMFVFPVWTIVGAVVGLSSSLSIPAVLGIILRTVLGVFLTLLGSYVFRVWNGFGEVRAGLITKVMVGCIFLLLLLQIVGVINLLPG